MSPAVWPRIRKMLFCFLFGLPLQVFSQSDSTSVSVSDSLAVPVRNIPNTAFGVGEVLTFDIRWGFISVGSAGMSIKGIVHKENRPCFELEATASSNKTLSALYPVNDLFLSYLDTASMLPCEYYKNQNEGDYHFDQHTIFHQRENIVYTWGKRTQKKGTVEKESTFVVPPFIFDVLSAFYYTRAQNLAVGDVFTMNNIDNNTLAGIRVRVLKQEQVSVAAGTFDCLVIEPQMGGIGLFKKKGKLRVWITRDSSQMPVLFKSKITIGSIVGELVAFEAGLR